MGGHGEEGSSEDAGPEGVGLGEVEGEVEDGEFVGGGGDGVDVLPAAGDVGAEGEDGDEGSADVDGHLDDVGPDDGGHAALEGVEEGEEGDDGDGEGVVGADGDADDDGDGEDADAFGSGSGEEEEAGGDFVEGRAEAAVDELVGGEHLAVEVFGEKEDGDDDAAEHVADDDLEEAEVSGEGYAGDGDDGEGGGFGGDDGEGDGPPGDGVVGEEVGLEGPVGGSGGGSFAEAEAEEGDADEVDEDEREVEGAKVLGQGRWQRGDEGGEAKRQCVSPECWLTAGIREGYDNGLRVGLMF